MRNVKILMLVMAACLAGCSSDDEPQNPVTQNTESKKTETQKTETPRLMYVDVMDAPEGGDAAAPLLASHRAGAPITTATLSSFSMNYTDSYHYDFTKTDQVWNTNTWPGGVENNTKIDFYAYNRDAYNHGSFNYNSGDPYVAFLVDETASQQTDLLVAEHKQISYNDAKGHVSLCFDHACAAVRFNVYLSNTLSTSLGGGHPGSLTVNSIILRNVIKTGKYYYNTTSWTPDESSTYFTLNNSEITVTTASQALSCGYLYMIPQARDANGTTGTYLEINYTKGTDKQATIPLDINWQKGKSYTINIKLTSLIIK